MRAKPHDERALRKGTTPQVSRWRSGEILRRDESEAGEICGVPARISGNQRASEHSGMRPNEKVGKDCALGSASTAVNNERLSCDESRFAREV